MRSMPTCLFPLEGTTLHPRMTPENRTRPHSAMFAVIRLNHHLMLGTSTVHQLESCLAPGQNGTGCAN